MCLLFEALRRRVEVEFGFSVLCLFLGGVFLSGNAVIGISQELCVGLVRLSLPGFLWRGSQATCVVEFSGV